MLRHEHFGDKEIQKGGSATSCREVNRDEHLEGEDRSSLHLLPSSLSSCALNLLAELSKGKKTQPVCKDLTQPHGGG